MSKISVQINLTFSKVLALLILLVGTFYAFYIKDGSNATVFITALGLAAGLAGYKNYTEHNEKMSPTTFEIPNIDPPVAPPTKDEPS